MADFVLVIGRYLLLFVVVAGVLEVGHTHELQVVDVPTVMVRSSAVLLVAHDWGDYACVVSSGALRTPQRIAAVLAVPVLTVRTATAVLLRLVFLMLVVPVMFLAWRLYSLLETAEYVVAQSLVRK